MIEADILGECFGLRSIHSVRLDQAEPPPGVPPMMAREEALPERGTFIRLQVYERVGILSV